MVRMGSIERVGHSRLILACVGAWSVLARQQSTRHNDIHAAFTVLEIGRSNGRSVEILFAVERFISIDSFFALPTCDGCCKEPTLFHGRTHPHLHTLENLPITPDIPHKLTRSAFPSPTGADRNAFDWPQRRRRQQRITTASNTNNSGRSHERRRFRRQRQPRRQAQRPPSRHHPRGPHGRPFPQPSP